MFPAGQSRWTWRALGRMGLRCVLPANPLAVPARPPAAPFAHQRPPAAARARRAVRRVLVPTGLIGRSATAPIPIDRAPIAALVIGRPGLAAAARPLP